MNSAFLIVQILITGCLIWATPAFAHQRFRDIPNGAIVEGSTRFSGIQPDYLIDADSKVFDELWSFADSIRQDHRTSLIAKVDILVKRVRSIFAQHHTYDDAVYLKLLAQYRESGLPVPLSKYVACGGGVCRENALVLHLLLKRAGIPNRHVYAKVAVDYGGSTTVPTDHAFVVFKHRGERWIADSYFGQFNGYSFDEFIESGGELIYPQRKLPFAAKRTEFRGITKLNAYPLVHTRAPISCRLVHH